MPSLERDFDGYANSHGTTRFLEPSWRSESEKMTRGEIPPIRLTGVESERFNGVAAG